MKATLIMQLVGQFGELLAHLSDLKSMSAMQWLTLAGFAIGGAATAYAATNPVSWPLVVAGALGGLVAHLAGQIQTAPKDRAKASQTVQIATGVKPPDSGMGVL